MFLTLSPEENGCACSFIFERDRSRYVSARRLLRKLIGYYSSSSPEEISFKLNLFGKPKVIAPEKAVFISFSISYADDMAIIAFSRDCPLGIDIEKNDTDFDFIAFSERFFFPAESNALKNSPAKGRKKLFFRIWVMKEALVKAEGTGFSVNPKGPLLPEEALWSDSSECLVLHDNRTWRTLYFEPSDGYSAAIAFPGDSQKIFVFETTSDSIPFVAQKEGASQGECFFVGS